MMDVPRVLGSFPRQELNDYQVFLASVPERHRVRCLEVVRNQHGEAAETWTPCPFPKKSPCGEVAGKE